MAAVDELRRALECPVCYERLKPPIETCANGHGICKNCRKSIEVCGICRRKFPGINNTLLNQVLENLLIKCKFNLDGCGAIVNINNVEEHEIVCAYRTVKCVLCDQFISIKKMNHHFNAHEEQKRYAAYFYKSFKNITVAERSSKNEYVMAIIKYEERYFYIRYKLDWKKKFAWICVMSTEDPSSQYMYIVTIKKNLSENNICFLTCSGSCVPYFYDKEKIEENPRSVYLNMESFLFENFNPTDGFFMSIDIKPLP